MIFYVKKILRLFEISIATLKSKYEDVIFICFDWPDAICLLRSVNHGHILNKERLLTQV